MKLRRLFRVAFLCFLLSLLSVSVHGAAPGYLVEIRQDVALFSDIQPEFGRPIHEETGLYYIEDPAMLQELEEAGLVESWCPNEIVHLHETTETPTLPDNQTWARSMVNYDYAASHGITGENVRVCIIDSGLRDDFSRFSNARIETGTNYLVRPGNSDRHNTSDEIGHGTFVSSVIADSNMGLAPSVTLIPLKCFGSSTTTLAEIIEAVYDAVEEIRDENGEIIDNDLDGYPDNYACDVLNLSFGYQKSNHPANIQLQDQMEKAIQYALDKGVIVVASAGNLNRGAISTGNDTYFYPASQDGVISVGSVDTDSIIAGSSVQNDKVFLTAPGASVYGLDYKTDTYRTDSGTSFSAPAVTAAAALALSLDPDMTNMRFQEFLQFTATDLGSPERDNAYGYGLLNLALLLETIKTEIDSVSLTANEGITFVSAAHTPMGLDTFTSMMAVYDSDGCMMDCRVLSSTNGSVLFNDVPVPAGAFCRIFTMDNLFTPLRQPRLLTIP